MYYQGHAFVAAKLHLLHVLSGACICGSKAPFVTCTIRGICGSKSPITAYSIKGKCDSKSTFIKCSIRNIYGSKDHLSHTASWISIVDICDCHIFHRGHFRQQTAFVTCSISDICDCHIFHRGHLWQWTASVTWSYGDICGNSLHLSRVLSWTFTIVAYSIGDICGDKLHSSHVLYQGPTWQHSSIISYFLSRRFWRLPRLYLFVQPRSFPRKCRVGIFSPLCGNNGVQTFISSPRRRSHASHNGMTHVPDEPWQRAGQWQIMWPDVWLWLAYMVTVEVFHLVHWRFCCYDDQRATTWRRSRERRY